MDELPLPYLSKAFATFLNEQSGNNTDPVVLLAAAFVSYELSRGEVFLDLNEFFEADEEFHEIDITSEKLHFKNWEKAFSQATEIIGCGAGNSPLVWDKTHHRLYLRRYWTYQKTVHDMIQDRLAPVREELPAEITAKLHELFLPEKGKTAQKPDWQKIACAVALRSKFSIITGGPGTGKTTTLTKLLILLVSLMRLEKGESFKPEILLAAPTGKAANRVSESINKALNKLAEDGVHLEESLEEQDNLKMIRRMHLEGLTLRKIAQEMNFFQRINLHFFEHRTSFFRWLQSQFLPVYFLSSLLRYYYRHLHL